MCIIKNKNLIPCPSGLNAVFFKSKILKYFICLLNSKQKYLGWFALSSERVVEWLELPLSQLVNMSLHVTKTLC